MKNLLTPILTFCSLCILMSLSTCNDPSPKVLLITQSLPTTSTIDNDYKLNTWIPLNEVPIKISETDQLTILFSAQCNLSALDRSISIRVTVDDQDCNTSPYVLIKLPSGRPDYFGAHSFITVFANKLSAGNHVVKTYWQPELGTIPPITTSVINPSVSIWGVP